MSPQTKVFTKTRQTLSQAVAGWDREGGNIHIYLDQAVKTTIFSTGHTINEIFH